MKQYVIDAFTDHVFAGNPAAVCVMDAWLPEGIGILRWPGIVRLCSRRGSSPQH